MVPAKVVARGKIYNSYEYLFKIWDRWEMIIEKLRSNKKTKQQYEMKDENNGT